MLLIVKKKSFLRIPLKTIVKETNAEKIIKDHNISFQSKYYNFLAIIQFSMKFYLEVFHLIF